MAWSSTVLRVRSSVAASVAISVTTSHVRCSGSDEQRQNSSTPSTGLAALLPESARFRGGLPRACRHPRTGRFVNPWVDPHNGNDICERSVNDVWHLLREWRLGTALQVSTLSELSEASHIDWDKVRAAKAKPDGPALAVWLGHASVLCVCGGNVILFDPVFSQRASPFWFAGPSRLVPCPMDVQNLDKWPDDLSPRLVAISHAHYDHLDEATVLALRQRFPSARWVAPLGLRHWFQRKADIELDAEMDWWDEAPALPEPGLSLVCLPAQHWSNRWPWDTNETLWCGYGILRDDQPREMPFLFTGDTGYCNVFALIGSKYNVGLAAVPIGAYEPRWFMAPQHCNPEEAVRIVADLNANAGISIHWGTFPLTNESPRQQLEDLVKARGDDTRLRAVQIGGAVSAAQDNNSDEDVANLLCG